MQTHSAEFGGRDAAEIGLTIRFKEHQERAAMYQRAVKQQRAALHHEQDLLDLPTIFVVDPDPATGAMTNEVLEGSEWRCEVFRSGRDFLAAYHDSRPGCLVLEQRIPDMSGLQLQHRLAASGSLLPLVFVTSNINVSTAVELMRGGAIHVLEKPARSIELLSAIQEAVAQNRERRLAQSQTTRIRELTATLTRKERQVLELIGVGRSIKVMASELELSVRAVELRRNSLMHKLGVRTSLELMRFAMIAMRGFSPQPDVDSSLVGACA